MEIKTPNERKIEEIFFLSKQAIVELDLTVSKIDKYLDDECKIDLEKEVKQLSEKSYNHRKSIDEIRQDLISDRYYSNYLYCYAYSSDGYKIELESIEHILKDETTSKFYISSIGVEIKHGNYEFELYIRNSKDRCISYKCSGLDEGRKKEVLYKFNSWYDTYKAKKIIHLWNKVDYWLKFVSVIAITVFVFGYLSYRVDSYNDGSSRGIKKQIVEQIDKGITNQDDLYNSVKLLLMNASGYSQVDYPVPEVNIKPFLVYLFVCLCLLVLSFSPKTRFEVGKGEAAYRRQRIWVNLVLYVIPVMIILPLVINLITK